MNNPIKFWLTNYKIKREKRKRRKEKNILKELIKKRYIMFVS
jgi:hypothetical protein